MYNLTFDFNGDLRISNNFDSEFYINTSFREIDEIYYNEIVYQWCIKNDELFIEIDENSMLYDYIYNLNCKEFNILIEQFIYHANYASNNELNLRISFNFERDMLIPTSVMYDGSPNYFEEFIKYRPKLYKISIPKYIVDFEEDFENINSLIKRSKNIKLIHGINKITIKKINRINIKIQSRIKDLARNIIITYNYDGKLYGKIVSELYKHFNDTANKMV